MALRLRRGTDAERQTIVPLQGELIFVTDTKKIYVGDGAALGGILVGPDDATAFDLINDQTPSLGGDLDLNGNDIIGTGNISINGFITATGNINLGDADNDAITVGGLINSSLRPATDDAYDLGAFNRQWRNVYASEMTIDTTLSVGDRIVKNSYGEDSTESVLWDAVTDTLTAATVVGNLVGSVFDESSIALVDATSGNMYTNTINIEVGVTGDNRIEFRSRRSNDNLKFVRYLDIPGNHTDIFTVTDNGVSTGENVFISRGTVESPLSVIAGDPVDAKVAIAHDGTNYLPTSVIRMIVDPHGSVSTGSVPGAIAISVIDGPTDTTLQKSIFLDSNGFVGVNNGYNQPQATLDINGFAKLAVLTSEPASLINGMIAIADGTSWDPSGGATPGKQQAVVYLGGGWRAMAVEP